MLLNDEPEKILNLLFSVYFFRIWVENFNKLLFFAFGQK